MAKIIEAGGQTREFPITHEVYDKAHAAGLTVEQYINREIETDANQPLAFDQISHNLGLNVDPNVGAVTRMRDVMAVSSVGGSPAGYSPGSAGTRPGSTEASVWFPAYVLSVIEDKIQPDLEAETRAYDSMIGHHDRIVGTEFVRPTINFDRVDESREGKTAQLALPPVMLTLTGGERSGTVPTRSVGLSVADQLIQRNMSIDIVALTVARFFMMQRHRNTSNNLLSLLNGNPDLGLPALGNEYYLDAETLDPAATTGLTQSAWVRALAHNLLLGRKTHAIGNLNGFLAVQNRKGRPVASTEPTKGGHLIDTTEYLMNTLVPDGVGFYVTDNPDWPDGVILLLDKDYAIARVTSASAGYQASDHDPIRRRFDWRWDWGSLDYRLFDEAFTVLTYNV